MYNTLEFFRTAAPSLSFWPKPLIWHKTDNRGITSDPRRGPRHIYEAAVFAAREDRPILTPIGDAYGSPTDKSNHTSAKPEPMLKHFFSMFVDEGTRMLDPTCGGGSALRAAESAGAQVLGLEKETEHVEAARKVHRAFRTLRAMTMDKKAS